MMKNKYFILFISFLFTGIGLSFGQDNTYTFSGAISGNVTWDSYDTVYVNGNITIGSSDSLAIEPNTNGTNAGNNDNVYIIFTGNYGITISNDGVLVTSGTSSDSIIFTADRDNDHSFGESGETWAHISFENTSTPDSSIIDYSVFEYGCVKDLSGTSGYGGALHINIDSIRVSNSAFYKDTAEWGGAIFINASKGPLIKRCRFSHNYSDNGGGGIYCWDGSDASIVNCIFDSNKAGYGTTTTYYTGGGVALQTNTDVTLFNCTFVNNDSNHDGDGLQFSGLGGTPNATNCIFWGSSSQVTGGQSTRLTNCAIQGSTSGTNTINLNSSNTGTNPYGPYFNATDGTDWSIKVISPCRDAGTDTGAPTTDFDGNSRVGTTDIGAYEIQYNQWKTTASTSVWNTAGNWEDGVPGSSENVVIPTGASKYPNVSTIQNYTIGTNYGMVLEPGAQVTLNSLIDNGDLKLMSDDTAASNISTLIITNEGVNAITELYLYGGGVPNYKWHYISSPFTSLDTSAFWAVTLNLAQYIESLCITSTDQGWVAADGWVYKTSTLGETRFDNLDPGKGYNFYDDVNNEIAITGQLKISDVNVNLSFGYHGSSISGFNLLGNPFSSGLNWEVIINDASYPDSTSKGLYFTRDNVQCSYVGGIGTPSDVDSIIPPMQGFFVKTYGIGSDNSLPLSANARVHNIHARYKGETIIPLIRLSLTKDSISDETVVRFDEQAKPELDYDFDALKMFLSDNKISIYSYTGETKYAINGLPFPENSMDIPLAINSPNADTLKITATQIQGLGDYDITLKDLDQNVSVDLNEVNEYIFNADSGTVTDRFILTISNNTTGLSDIFEPEPEKAFNIYSSHGILFINPAKDAWNGRRSDLRIYDITGKIVKQQNNIEWQKGVTKEIYLNVAQGIYFVEIRSESKRFVGKVSIVR